MAAKKKYGPKMANPRISASKEHRSCGPIGYMQKAEKGLGPRITYKKIVIRSKKRLQVTREEVLKHFDL